jgi:hypothetical protein
MIYLSSMAARTRKRVEVRRVPVQGDVTPKYRVGELVFCLEANGITPREVTTIILIKDKFFYAFAQEVVTPGDLYLSDFEPESAVFPTKEELLASL